MSHALFTSQYKTPHGGHPLAAHFFFALLCGNFFILNLSSLLRKEMCSAQENFEQGILRKFFWKFLVTKLKSAR